MIYQRKYGVASTSDFYILHPMLKRGAVDFTITGEWTPAAGDVRVSKDGGATWANIATLPTAVNPGTNGGAYTFRFEFSAAELQCKQLNVMVSDAATKAIEDAAFVVETYGHASAMYPRDISTDNTTQELTDIADAVWKRDLSAVTGEARRSPLNAIRKLLNKWTNSGGVLTVYKEDDATQAYTEATSSAAGNPVTGSDPN